MCNDNDNCPNTPNADQADADGDGIGDACDSGTPCDNVQVTESGNTITVADITTSAPVHQLWVFDANWTTVYSCNNNCAEPTVVSNLADGLYHVKIKLLDASWNLICEEIIDITIGGGSPLMAPPDDNPQTKRLRVQTEVNNNDQTGKVPDSNEEIKANDAVIPAITLLSIHPNPATDQITLMIDNDIPTNRTLRIYDLHGRLVIEQNVALTKGLNRKRISISSLPNGIYFIKPLDANAYNNRLRFVKL